MKRYSTTVSDYQFQAMRRGALPAAVLPMWNVTFTVTDLRGTDHEKECRELRAASASEAHHAALRYACLYYGTLSNPRNFVATRA